MATSVETVKADVPYVRPSVPCRIATDWLTDGYLKWCLMYSRTLIRSKVQLFCFVGTTMGAIRLYDSKEKSKGAHWFLLETPT
uniref:Uncharacterized protein n=1 Tax=Rhizoctonia solani TaxID=456999 RepID=N0A396_9AGAM|nr:hypothetical protein RSOL_m01270 [Rhizoctonia solani]AGK45439.1 hypothetical protein RSOL_m01270 [Rhizoctonia solani]